MSGFERIADGFAEIQETPWSCVTTGAVIGVSLFALFCVYFSHTGERWVPIIDNANLVFHEAGHPLFGLITERLAVYGGTLGQLAFPLVTAISFWMKRQAASFAACVIWLGENLFNIAVYMADARAKQLPLIGGLDPELAHDWAEILGRWHALQFDTRLAGLIRFGAWCLMLAVIGWLAWRWREDRAASD